MVRVSADRVLILFDQKSRVAVGFNPTVEQAAGSVMPSAPVLLAGLQSLEYGYAFLQQLNKERPSPTFYHVTWLGGKKNLGNENKRGELKTRA